MVTTPAGAPLIAAQSIADPPAESDRAALDACIDRAVAHMRSIQHPDGYWWAELEANATMAAEHVMLERMLGIADARRTPKIAAYLRGLQSADGSWPIYHGGSGDVSVTTEAYFALKLCGEDPSAPHMMRARDWVLAHGGIARTRVFTKLWLALFGQFDWSAMPCMPPEAILFPSRFPFNIYEFASWARATMVPILVVWSKRPIVAVTPHESVAELCVDPADRARAGFARGERAVSWRNFFLAADRALRMHERSPWKPLRRRALRACEHWIVDHQEADGSWGGIQPPWVYSLIALKALGYGNDHPVMANGIAGLLGSFALETDTTWTVQPCLSPVWDTALAVTGMRECGVAPDDPSMRIAGEWILRNEIRAPGDWCVKVKGIEPGGWAFEFANDKYPDTDDTAEVLIALRLLGMANHTTDNRQQTTGGGASFADARGAMARAIAWLRAMQSSNGGWGAFDRDNTRRFVTQIPFADFGATLDPPSEDVTAHIVEQMALLGVPSSDPMMRRAIDYLWRTQEPDGSWFGRWGVNYVYGTGAVVPALVAAGVSARDARIQRAAAWLRAHQNDDGGWGETCASYDDPSLRGRGESTASQTAWALLALLAADGPASDTVARGVRHLVETQAADGQWEEAAFTGTGFPRDFMLKYHLYRNYWPMWALGRYRRLRDGAALHLPRTDALS
jgi:squalene-hopene/tetraprenyl-beta-curcumene cyclase